MLGIVSTVEENAYKVCKLFMNLTAKYCVIEIHITSNTSAPQNNILFYLPFLAEGPRQ